MNEDSRVNSYANLKRLGEEIKKELDILIVIAVLTIIILKIAFYKEPLSGVLKFGLSLLYFSLLPGYFLLLNFKENLSREVRVALSFPIGFGVYAIFGYYLNIFINLKYVIFLSIIVVLISVLIYLQINNKQENDHKI